MGFLVNTRIEMSDRNYTVRTKILRPVSEVFDAVVNEKTICEYFAERVSGPLREGEEVFWFWEGCGESPVTVTKVVENALIEMEFDSRQWDKTPQDSYQVTVRMEFEELAPESTMLSISELGWRTDEKGLKGSHENCSGWTHMAMCLKAFLEHGLDLRK